MDDGRRVVNMDDLSHKGQPYPGSDDGMSVNRAKYSLPSDVLISTVNPTWGVAGLQRKDLPSNFEPPTDKDGKWDLRPKHDPVCGFERKDGKKFPDNFAHTLLMHYRNDVERPGKRVSKTVARTFSSALCERFIPILDNEAT